jgi:hypothetical protein
MNHYAAHAVMHAARKQAAAEREKGHPNKASAIMLIGSGLVLLPIPIIGLPLLIWGICKACSSGES